MPSSWNSVNPFFKDLVKGLCPQLQTCLWLAFQPTFGPAFTGVALPCRWLGHACQGSLSCLSDNLSLPFQITWRCLSAGLSCLLHRFDLPFKLAGPANPDSLPPACPEALPILHCSSGVLLQAHVIAAIMNWQQQQPSSFDINAEQQESVLATALASAVWQVCTSYISQVCACCERLWKCQVLASTMLLRV